MNVPEASALKVVIIGGGVVGCACGREGHDPGAEVSGGWCQGRMCGSAIVEILARRRGVSREEVHRMTGRPPVKPIPLSMLLEYP